MRIFVLRGKLPWSWSSIFKLFSVEGNNLLINCAQMSLGNELTKKKWCALSSAVPYLQLQLDQAWIFECYTSFKVICIRNFLVFWSLFRRLFIYCSYLCYIAVAAAIKELTSSVLPFMASMVRHYTMVAVSQQCGMYWFVLFNYVHCETTFQPIISGSVAQNPELFSCPKDLYNFIRIGI